MAKPAFYITQEDLEAQLSPTTVMRLFDDENTGTANASAINRVLSRACSWVDSFLARVYRGPFPVPQRPVPQVIIDCALEFAIAFSFERHPEYVATYGESYRADSRFERACAMAERLCNGLQEIPDWVLQPKAGNIGGIVMDNAQRVILDSPDGTRNNGDF